MGAVFLGVPYAAPPVGARRWAPPGPIEPRGELRPGGHPLPAPPQPPRPPAKLFFGTLGDGSEDCLGLNAWTPATDGPPRPVLVFLHGGGFTIGGIGSAVLDGAALAAALDAVVVCPAYRLGTLGWLHHPALAAHDGAPAGNWGLQDQLAALRFLAEHAGALGGDPDRVTLAGESAGAASVAHLLGWPATRGLFRRAILMSPPLGEATHPAELGDRWAEAMGAALAGGLDLAALRAVAASDVVAAQERLLGDPPWAGTRGGALPVLDPATIAADPLERPGAAPEVDVLVGTSADEATFFFRMPGRVLAPDPQQLLARVAHLPGVESASDALVAYADALGTDDANELLVRIATDAMFVDPVERWAAGRARAGGRVHRYRLEQPSAQPGLGSVHSLSVPLLFGTHATSEPGAWVAGTGPVVDATSAAMQHAWRAFVHDGDPGWAPLDAAGATSEVGVLGGPDGAFAVGGRRAAVVPGAFGAPTAP